MLALREGDGEGAQLAALSELCELLAVSSEDSLSMFPIDSLVPVLVRARGPAMPALDHHKAVRHCHATIFFTCARTTHACNITSKARQSCCTAVICACT